MKLRIAMETNTPLVVSVREGVSRKAQLRRKDALGMWATPSSGERELNPSGLEGTDFPFEERKVLENGDSTITQQC